MNTTRSDLLPIYDLATADGREGLEGCLARLGATASHDSEAARTVAQILADVREHGDEAVARCVARFTDPSFTADRIRVSPDEIAGACERVDGTLMEAIEAAIGQVEAYQRHILPCDPEPIRLGGAELGLRFTPVERVGLVVPGGTAVLFSTLVMLAVPALVAGVGPGRISVVHPMRTRRGDEPVQDVSPIVLATCRRLGIERVYRIGGAEAVAALAYGTETVEPVDLIAGPGNVYVQLAKAQVAGVTGTDGGFYGPSEIVTVADETASPACVAADLIAQAEHDPGKCFLVVWSRAVLEAIVGQVEAQLPERGRREAIERALRDESCAVLVRDADEAVTVADRFAAEHVNLAVREPEAMLRRLRNGGEVFLGDQTPVAAGDYYAGPSHCLPTGRTARFTSGISVYTFLKRTGTVAYGGGMPEQAIEHIAAMAEAEGLDGHAASVRVRRSVPRS